MRQSCTPNPLAAAQDGRSPRVILVTGSAGFVGMHAAMQLRKRGDGELPCMLEGGVCRVACVCVCVCRVVCVCVCRVACVCVRERVLGGGHGEKIQGQQAWLNDLVVPLQSSLQHLLHSTHPPHSTTHTHTPFSATGVVGLDNFNDYYPVSLKRARQLHAEAGGVHTVDGDINDVDLLGKLFAVCQFTHVVHMAAQVCVGRGVVVGGGSA